MFYAVRSRAQLHLADRQFEDKDNKNVSGEL